MKPIMKINNHDYTAFLAEDGLKPVRNDLDADGSGRNLLDGLMYRSRLTSKQKWTVKFNRVPELIVKSISDDLDNDFVQIMFLNPATNSHVTKPFYTSTLDYGNQKYDRSDNLTYYDGCTFNMTER